ncbi:MAG: hypothetical protein M3460_19910 [Actinomycetota bacterium]|nr:hypothetical protein [Actinomycetota bacterium]
MAAPNIGHSILRVLNFFVVVILVLLLLNLLGEPIADAIPNAAQAVADVARSIWNGVQGLVPDGYGYDHR